MNAKYISSIKLLKRPLGWVCLFLFAFFTYMRFTQLTDRPMHNDEGVNGFFTTNLIRDNDWKYDPNNYHGPTLYYFQLITSWTAGFIQQPTKFEFSDHSGLSVYTARLTIVVASLLILGLFVFCRRIIGSWGAFCAFFLVGTSCTFLFYSRYFIHEIFVVLFTFSLFLSVSYFYLTKRVLFAYLTGLSSIFLFATKETGVIHVVIFGLAFVAAKITQTALLRNTIMDLVDEFFKSFIIPIRKVSQHLPHIFIFMVGIWVLLFTSFLKNPAGLWDSIAAYMPWLRQGLDSEHVKTASYFLKDILLSYELPLILTYILGAGFAFKNKSAQGLFLFYWSAGTITAYSIIPYKTPWCGLNFIVPLALSGGYGVDVLIRQVIGTRNIFIKKWGGAILAGAFLGIVAFQFKKTWVINYYEYDDHRHKMIYGHTSNDVFRLLKAIDDVALKTGEGRSIVINNVSPEYWPLPFYLKEYSAANFWGKVEGVEPLDAPIVISRSSQRALVQAHVKDSYSIETYNLRPGILLDMWVNNKYTDRTEPPQSIPELLTPFPRPQNLIRGLKLELFEGVTIKGRTASVEYGNVDFNFYFDVEKNKHAPPPYTLQWSGFLLVPVNGIVRFHLDSDDGSSLYMDDQLIIDNSGIHALQRKSSSVNIKAGYHKIELQYTDIGGYAQLGLSWRLPGKVEEKIPAQYFFGPS